MSQFDPLAVDIPRLLAVLEIDALNTGDSWLATCPRGHQDRNPSWGIIDDPGEQKHGCHFCHSCKWGGTATGLVAELLGISYWEAKRFISEHAMGRPRNVARVTIDISPIRKQKMRFPPGVQISPLTDWPIEAARYVLNRGITVEQIDRWKLGYATTGRLANRIVIPIWSADPIPRLLHYTARSYGNSPAKYKSALRDEGFDDSAIFGEATWPSVGHRQTVVVLEGAFNALAIERLLPGQPVASLFGSNVTVSHLCKLATFRRAVVLTDSDPAGDRAAEKLVGAFSRHLDVIRPELPRDQDANDLERKYPELLRGILAECGLPEI